MGDFDLVNPESWNEASESLTSVNLETRQKANTRGLPWILATAIYLSKHAHSLTTHGCTHCGGTLSGSPHITTTVSSRTRHGGADGVKPGVTRLGLVVTPGDGDREAPGGVGELGGVHSVVRVTSGSHLCPRRET